MLPRSSRPLSQVRAFIRAPPVCAADATLDALPACRAIPSRRVIICSHSRAHFVTAATQQTTQKQTVQKQTVQQTTQSKAVPYALTAAARAFEEQVQRGELEFLPQAYEHLRQVILEADRRGLMLSDADGPVVSEDVIKHSMALLVASPLQEHAVLHLGIFNDLALLRVRAEMAHPLEFAAQIFHEDIKSGTPNEHIYGHIKHLAEADPDSRKVFWTESAAWRAISWMQRLASSQTPELLPRLLHDLPHLFGLHPTLAHHHLVIKGFLSGNMPDEAWTWLRQMELHAEHPAGNTIWLKPETAQYDLLMRYFAERGDVVSARMLLAHMSTYAEPSKLSYHLILAAILTGAPTSTQQAPVAAAVEEMERAGYGVHLKTLGGIAGRGPLVTWVTDEVFSLLRASQERSNARTNVMQKAPHGRRLLEEPVEIMGGTVAAQDGQMEVWSDQTKENSNHPEAEYVEEPPPLAFGDLPACEVPTAQYSHVAPQDRTPAITHMAIEALEADTQASPHQFEDNPPHGSEDALPVPASQSHTAKSDAAVISMQAEDRTPTENLSRFGQRPHDTSPTDTANHESAAGVIVGAEDASSSAKPPEIPPREDAKAIPLSDRLRLKMTTPAHPPADEQMAMPPKLPEQTELQHSEFVESVELGLEARTDPQQQAFKTSLGPTADLSRLKTSDNSQPGPSNEGPSTLGSEPSDHDECPQNSKLPLNSQAPDVAHPTISSHQNSRIRRKYNRLIHNAIKSGDLRAASKAYAEMIAVTGSDIETGCMMIKSLCQGHLLKPPPRPHIMQSMRIYRSLVEVEKQDATVQNFFDSANRADPKHTKIDAHIYKDLLRALSSSSPEQTSARDFSPDTYEEYAGFVSELLTDMKARGLRPDDRTALSILLLRFKAAKSHQDAFKCYQSVVADDTDILSSPQDQRDYVQSTPGIGGCKIILKAFASLSFPDAPVAPAHLWFSIADDMRARGYTVTVEDYTRFLTVVLGKLMVSQEVQLPIPSDAFPSRTQIRVHATNTVYKCVQYVHKRLVLDANISPDPQLLNTLMNVYQHLGAFEDALRVFNMIWLSGRMDPVTPIIIFDACGHARRQHAAYIIWCMLVAKGWRFDKHTLDTWVECLCRTNVEAACRFVCVFMGREDAGYLSEGDTRPDVQTCLILLKLSWLQGQNTDVKARIKVHLPHIWDKLAARHQ